MTLSWPNHPLTLVEWEALPEESERRLELVEGMLVMSPQPFPWHQRAGTCVCSRLDEQLPSDVIALTEVEIVVAERPPTVRVPDLIVVQTVVFETNPPRVPASEVLLAVEILSDGTRRVDRVHKFTEYAEAGIPQYWIIDIDRPTTMLAFVLVDGTYELSGEHTGAVTLDVAGHPVTIDLDALTRR